MIPTLLGPLGSWRRSTEKGWSGGRGSGEDGVEGAEAWVCRASREKRTAKFFLKNDVSFARWVEVDTILYVFFSGARERF
jgi:hypothetical protein